MKRLKRFLISICLNKTQRRIIWQAITFSEYKYRQRGQVDESLLVMAVMNDTEELFDVIKRTYTKEEVDLIVDKAVKDCMSAAEARVRAAYQSQQSVSETSTDMNIDDNKDEPKEGETSEAKS